MIFFPSRVLAICTGAEAEVVVAAADGTIHEAHVKSLSPVHGHREKQKQKAPKATVVFSTEQTHAQQLEKVGLATRLGGEHSARAAGRY